MTSIDFHSNVIDRLTYTCRLVRKARAAQCRIVLLAGDTRQQAELDEALWTFSATDFLTHCAPSHPHAAHTPIILVADDVAELPHHQVLINLSGRMPAHFARFERMFEIIGDDEADKAAGRDRYRYYKDRGYPLTHYVAEAV